MSLIEVRNLYKSFGESSILENVDLTVEKGERIAILGESGCGKSVFLRCLELLEVPDSGQILIDGEDIAAPGAKVDKIRRNMGMVFQRFHLFSHMNVMDNLCLAPCRLLGMPREEAEEKAKELLGQVGLAGREDRMPSVLSGGQQQRVAICRSLMMDPQILLLDEPTSALDPAMVGEVLAVIRMLSKRSLTMLFVTHEMNFAREISTRVLFLAQRGIYEEGTPEEIFDHPKKELTTAFIQKIKSSRYEIRENPFDLMAIHGGIHTFGEKYGLSSGKINRLQICCEELIYEMIQGACNNQKDVDLILEITHAEVSDQSEIVLTCGGRKYNPFTDTREERGLMDEDYDPSEDIHLGITIIQQVSSQCEHSYENGVNRITVRM